MTPTSTKITATNIAITNLLFFFFFVISFPPSIKSDFIDVIINMFAYISISIKITPKLTLIVCDNDGATDNDTAYTLGEGKG